MEPVISKRGKLIFEDDFSGKELLWVAGPGEWKITKRTAATRSTGSGNDAPQLSRPFTAVDIVIVEFRAYLWPDTKWFYTQFTEKVGGSPPLWGFCIWPQKRTAAIKLFDKRTKKFGDLAAMPFPITKPRWCTILIEVASGQVAMTVDGRAIRAQIPVVDQVKKGCFVIHAAQDNPNLIAIDDVKVYEALPKDEDDKSKKKHKKR